MSSTERPARGSRLLLLPLLGLVRLYRLLLSPLLGPACRFEPTCSRYAEESLRTHGVGLGLWYALRRLCRCHPFCAGGFDPVPPAHRSQVRQEGKVNR